MTNTEPGKTKTDADAIRRRSGLSEGQREPAFRRALKELGLVPAVDPGAGAMQAEARTQLEDKK